MKRREQKPPAWAQRFVEWYCKSKLAEDLIGDMNEYFERNVKSLGVRRARMIYVIDAFKFFRAYTVRAPKFINLFINWIMIGSYIKTSGRNLMRNKLFSSINIAGLAISMSVGLLLIAFVHDVLSYDKFHERGDRIYRITNLTTFGDNQQTKFASTSVRTGRLIQEKVSGIEESAIIRQEFSGDAQIGDNTVPLSGLYAEPAVFKIFTFPMVKGDPATSLKDPYSIVLTETAARKLFGDEEALGKGVRFDTLEYNVTGVMKDVPFFSHLKFEALVSFSTMEVQMKDDTRFPQWTNMWSNYVYTLLPEDADLDALQSQLDAISKEENKPDENTQIQLELLPLRNIVLGGKMSNAIGPMIPKAVLWILSGLAMIVILSACFNYTNLSVARAMHRFKEVGLRKAIGAGKRQVRYQFLSESIIISLAALLLSFLIFLVLRPQVLNMGPELQSIIKLDITTAMVAAFMVLSIAVGAMAGFVPAFFFAKVSIIQALRDVSSVRLFKRINFRRVLVVLQYTITLIFITTTIIGYTQYKSFLTFDLGFDTANILNIQVQGNNSDVLVKTLSEMPEVSGISRSSMITSIGNHWGGHVKYKDSRDSALVWYNRVDENYLPLHKHRFLAGGNFVARPITSDATSEIIVNEQLLKRFNIAPANPQEAIGEVLTVDGKKLAIVGVMKDFHYGRADSPMEPVAFTFWTSKSEGFVNAKVQSTDMPGTMAKIEESWKKIDKIHPFDARFYNDAIVDAYGEFSAMIKIIGFLSFLAISIASMGLFGMVVFTTETKLKEISIRKVLGASPGNLVYLLSRNFLLLLTISAVIALPITYFFFDSVILTNFPFHNPIGIAELFGGVLGVLLIAFVMIGSQTMKAAGSNPAEVLKSE